MKIPIAREGQIAAVVYLICTVLSLILSVWSVFFLCLLALIFTLSFFRDPERNIEIDDKIILSPADGKIIAIDNKKSPFDGIECKRVCIFMSAANVHVNRMPVSGKIEKIAYNPGSFLVASKKEAEENERQAYLIKSNNDSFTVIQIAGLVARRIVSYVNEGDELIQGNRFGIIQLGSRVDIYMPNTCTVSINVGDKVKAGLTVIGRR